MMHTAMKKLFLLLGLAWCCLAGQAVQAQVQLGARLGVNVARATALPTNAGVSIERAAAVAGVYGRYFLPDSTFFIQPELLFSMKGGDYDLVTSGGTLQVHKLRVNTIDVPVLFGRRLGKWARLSAGPVLGVVSSASLSVNNQTQALAQRNNLLASAMLGAGLSLKRLEIDLRYEVPFTAIDDAIGLKTSVLQIAFGLRFK